MKVIMSNKVKENLAEIYNYIAKDSIKYANKTIENIYTRIEFLKFSPYLGRHVPELSSQYYRELIYKSYRIVYTVDEKTDTIYIHFIIHSKRNFNSFCNSNFFQNWFLIIEFLFLIIDILCDK